MVLQASVEAFARRGVRVEAEALDRLVAASVAAVLSDAPVADSMELTAAEVAALERGALQVAPPREVVDRVLAGSAARLAALLGTAYTVAETAALLGIDGSRVRHRLAARTLYGVRSSEGWRLPRFQFDAARKVPGIERVVPRLEPGLHPLTVAGWFTTPDPDLVLERVALSPRDWLRAGGDVAVVASLAEAVGSIA